VPKLSGLQADIAQLTSGATDVPAVDPVLHEFALEVVGSVFDQRKMGLLRFDPEDIASVVEAQAARRGPGTSLVTVAKEIAEASNLTPEASIDKQVAATETAAREAKQAANEAAVELARAKKDVTAAERALRDTKASLDAAEGGVIAATTAWERAKARRAEAQELLHQARERLRQFLAEHGEAPAPATTSTTAPSSPEQPVVLPARRADWGYPTDTSPRTETKRAGWGRKKTVVDPGPQPILASRPTGDSGYESMASTDTTESSGKRTWWGGRKKSATGTDSAAREVSGTTSGPTVETSDVTRQRAEIEAQIKRAEHLVQIATEDVHATNISKGLMRVAHSQARERIAPAEAALTAAQNAYEQARRSAARAKALADDAAATHEAQVIAAAQMRIQLSAAEQALRDGEPSVRRFVDSRNELRHAQQLRLTPDQRQELQDRISTLQQEISDAAVIGAHGRDAAEAG